ncbi:MAG: ParA family protein [Coriobacteriia bacterium]|nr:ParA family protein [Coriobacteriia bacterium]
MTKAKIIAIANEKGGVGKSTTAAALGSVLIEMGNRVLWIDMDPQSSLTNSLGLKEVSAGIYDVLVGDIEISKTVLSNKEAEKIFWLIPACARLANVEKHMDEFDKLHILKEAIEEISSQFDYIIIDTPGQLDILTISSLVAADEVIIPVMAEAFSRKSFKRFMTTVRGVKKRINKDLVVAGVLITRFVSHYNTQKKVAQDIAEEAANLDLYTFNVTIRNGVAAQEAHDLDKHIIDHKPKSAVAQDYREAVLEYLEIAN